MKRFLPIFLLMALAGAFLAGCKTDESDEAQATVPWGRPADFEGAGVGLPQMDGR
jgi:hypothetical protein